jgi:O-antigen/teichoic acid export membrane protein
MDIAQRFKRDLGYYLLVIIVPGGLNAALIPVLKRLLGAADFGKFSIKYSLLLFLVSAGVGWISQGVVRFRFVYGNQEKLLVSKIFRLCLIASFSIATVLYLGSRLFHDCSRALSFMMFTAFVLCAFQNVLISLAQANFLARFILISESVRTATFFVLGVLLLRLWPNFPQEALFFALNISYLISLILLMIRTKAGFAIAGIMKTGPAENAEFKMGGFFGYGLPLAFWFVLSYGMTYFDKIVLAKSIGYEAQGNYQSLFDLISKGVVYVLLPVTNALFPLFTKAFESGDKTGAFRLLKKLLFMELALVLLGAISYWPFGFKVLSWLLKVPPSPSYATAGFLAFLGAALWQMAMLLHKPLEMQKRTITMLKMNLVSFAIFGGTLVVVWILNSRNVQWYALPYLLGGITYALLCLVTIGRDKKNSLFGALLRLVFHKERSLKKQ